MSVCENSGRKRILYQFFVQRSFMLSAIKITRFECNYGKAHWTVSFVAMFNFVRSECNFVSIVSDSAFFSDFFFFFSKSFRFVSSLKGWMICRLNKKKNQKQKCRNKRKVPGKASNPCKCFKESSEYGGNGGWSPKCWSWSCSWLWSCSWSKNGGGGPFGLFPGKKSDGGLSTICCMTSDGRSGLLSSILLLSLPSSKSGREFSCISFIWGLNDGSCLGANGPG